MFIWRVKFVGSLFELFVREKCSKSTSLVFLSNLLPGETLCKFLQIFPPKDLVNVGKLFVHTF